MIDGQPFPSVNSLDTRVTANGHGSLDLYCGPEKPGTVPEGNWLRTNPGEGYFLNLRLYGPTHPFYDNSWIPGHAIKLS